MKFYELIEQYERLLNTDIEDEGVLNDTLEGLDGDIEDKADNIACIIKELNADVEAIKQEEKNLAQRRKSKESKINQLKTYLLINLQQLNKNKIETARNVISLRKNPASLKLADDFYNEDYQEVIETVKIDKTRIKDDLKSGKVIAGATLEQGTSLNIK